MEGSEVEVTLSPHGPLLDGSKGRAFVIRHKLAPYSSLKVNNIPIGRYKIRARLLSEGGKPVDAPLELSENAIPSKAALSPSPVAGEATLLLRSDKADSNLTILTGGMDSHELSIERAP